MLIVEGPDGVGKTTMCQALVRQLHDHVYAHFTRLPDGFDRYWGYVERASPLVVQDRFHMSEIAYSRARDDETALTPETYRLVDAHLRALGSFVVVVTADPDLVQARWSKGQMYDPRITIRAATEFLNIVEGRLPDYRFDVDLRFHCDREQPYVSDEQVRLVLDRYRFRLREVLDVAARRPRRL